MRPSVAGSSGPVGGVPPADIPIFQGAAARFGLRARARGPSVLAAINYVESTFGQSNDAGVHSGANYAGAMGPMQFLQGTWDTYKVQAPGGAVPPNIYDEADAVYSAANYLQASGAPGDWPGAIFAYNHSSAYVQQVLSQATGYYTQGLTAQGPATSTPTSSSPAATTGAPFSVPAATSDPAGPITLAPGQPTIVAATYFTDATGAWGDNLLVNHIPGFTIGRDDMGVDASAPVGTPIYAPLDSQLVELVGNWYAGQPLLLFRFLNRPAGALSDYWYVAEEITPVSTTVGTIFRARQAVARFAPSGTGIEIGWGSPTSSGRTLAQQMGDSAAANPPASSQPAAGPRTYRPVRALVLSMVSIRHVCCCATTGGAAAPPS